MLRKIDTTDEAVGSLRAVEADPIAALLEMETGMAFVLRGRVYVLGGYEGRTFRAQDGVERVEGVKAWTKEGRATRLVVKATDRLRLSI